MSNGTWWRVPRSLIAICFSWSKPQRNALAEFGDMPHMFKVEENLSDDDRRRIVHEAEQLLVNYSRYKWLWTNCEHVINMITKKGQFTSPSDCFLLWAMFRYTLAVIGLLCLRSWMVRCGSDHCREHPRWEIRVYYMLTVVPVGAQAIMRFVRLSLNLRCIEIRNVLSSADLWHLRTMELWRMIMGAGIAVLALTQIPHFARNGGDNYPAALSFIVVFAYLVSDALYCAI